MMPRVTFWPIAVTWGLVLAVFVGAGACDGTDEESRPTTKPAPSTRPVAIAPDRTDSPVEVEPPVLTDADYAEHILALKRKYADMRLTYVVEKPFVVVGNQGIATTRKWSVGTVRWSVRLLKKDYFPLDPDHIITIWLMGDRTSYAAACRKVAGRKPTTPYGFYSPSSRALLMNISTGGGTLVHEIVHPFIAANFPRCPPWFNEGLGSLYEQCSERGGKILGRTNWRLAGLQKLIRKKALPSFEDLCRQRSAEFYKDSSGGNYAQARYLCYYLQERGLLRTFYKAFRAGRSDDPTGYKTLVRTLGVDDMVAFQKTWESYCLKLRFPE